MRKYVSLKKLKYIYFAIFVSYVSYCCLVWAQNFSAIEPILILQTRLLELLISNQGISIPVPYSKFQNKIFLENILFLCKSLNNLSPSICNTRFSFSSDQHNYETWSSTKGTLMKLFYRPNRYEKYSITVSAAQSWNKIQKQLKNMLLKDLSPNKLKQLSLIFVLSHINNSFDHAKI